MGDFLFHYESVEPTTWVYLSSLLLIGLFFKFGRFWSVRNLDLVLLILLGPGLLLVHYGQAGLGELYQESTATQVAEEAGPPAAENADDEGVKDGIDGDGVTQDAAEDASSTRVEDANDEVASDDVATDDVANDEVASDDVATNDLASDDVASDEVASDEVASDEDLSREDAVAADSVDLESDQESASGDLMDAPNPPDDAEEDLAAKPWMQLEVTGFIFLFGVGTLLLTRLLLDPIMVRRPLLEPNLSLGGLAFIGCSLFVFLMANVVAEPVTASDATDYRIARVAAASGEGPGYELLSQLPSGMTKFVSIVSQLLVVVGMVLIGYRHFRNVVMGIGAATLYLMLPYTSLLTGRVEHVLPAATLVWAVLMYRRPLIAGALIGLASGLVYYPFFLLPLWLSFYWHRGFSRFLTAYLSTVSLLVLVLLVFSSSGLRDDLIRMFGLWTPAMTDLGGIWGSGGFDGHYRLPVLVTFVALSISMSLWPAQKNLGTLLSCTAAIMVAAQFWHGYGGGTYMAWYLPLLLLTVFRPNLEDRVAVTVLEEDGWFGRGKLSKAA